MKLTKKEIFRQSLKIPVEGNPETIFYCKQCGLVLAFGYNRIVIGDRGPYIEFEPHQIEADNIFYPRPQKHVYFYEYSSRCECRVFIYFQRQTVSYADYQIGKYYISPELLAVEERHPPELAVDKIKDLVQNIPEMEQIKELF